jgi:uncharacterized membrane protein
MEKATFGLDENIASALTYVLGFITGIIFILVEKENKTVRFHAAQSTIVFGGFFVLYIIIMVLLFIVPFIGILSLLIWLLELICWIVLIIKAYQGEKFKLPVVGDMAETWV